MVERWDKIIEHELLFYANFKQYEDELNDRLKENDLDIKYPTTTFDEEQGRVYLSCPGTEEQAMKRIEVREAIESLRKRAMKRIERLANTLKQLNEDDFEIISMFYLESGLKEKDMVRTAGFRTSKEFHEARRQALLKMADMYDMEREEKLKLIAHQRKEERLQRVAEWKERQREQRMNKIKIVI